MNRQDAKNAKKRKSEENNKPRTIEAQTTTIFSFFFRSFFSWRSWRLGGSFGSEL